jgi:hypothetical protein
VSGERQAARQAAPSWAADAAAVAIGVQAALHAWSGIVRLSRPEAELVKLIVGVVTAVVLACVAVGLWRRRRWARTTALWLCGLKVAAWVIVIAVVKHYAVEALPEPWLLAPGLLWQVTWLLPMALLLVPSCRVAFGRS